MLTTFQAAARLNARAAEHNEPRRYTASHVAALCGEGKLAGTLDPALRRWLIAESAVEEYAAAPKPKGGRPRKGAK